MSALRKTCYAVSCGDAAKKSNEFLKNSTDFVPNRYVFEKYRDRQFMRGSTEHTQGAQAVGLLQLGLLVYVGSFAWATKVLV